VSEKQEKKGWWRWGVNRWFVLLFIVAGYFAAKAYPPIQPHVQLPAENVSHHPLFHLPFGLGDFYLTNTLIALLIADVILLLMWSIPDAPRLRCRPIPSQRP